MRRLGWLVVLALGSVAGCTSLLGDFEIAPTEDGQLDGSVLDSAAIPHADGGTVAADARADQATRETGSPDATADGDAPCDPTTQKKCGTKCVELADPAFGCANVATCSPCTYANATAKCDRGLCAFDVCASGYADCANGIADGCETNTAKDPAHCGACTTACSTTGGTPNCAGGTCSSVACSPGHADCNTKPADGCEVTLDTDVANCGTCNHACVAANGTSACGGGACSFTCAGLWGHCAGSSTDKDGCNVDMTKDDKNCGACGKVCGAGLHCSGGACVCDSTSCSSGCCSGGSCIAPSTNACGIGGGACASCQVNVAFASGATCTAGGACDYAACAAGHADVDGSRANGCESTLPTGVAEAGNLVLWLAGDNGWDGTNWKDLSSGGRNAMGGFSGAPATGTLNGKNVVNFNGSELLISAGFPAWTGVTVFAVANTSADDSLIAMGVSYNPSCTTTAPLGAPGCVAYDMLAFGGAMGLQQCDPSIGSCWQAYSPAVPLNTWVRTTAALNPAANPSFHSYFNGVDNGALNHNLAYPYPAPWATPRKDTILGWRNYRGQVAELIVFNTFLPDADRVAIDAYLAKKWKVP